MIWTALIFCLLGIANPIAMQKHSNEVALISDAIGVRTLNFHDEKRNRPVIVEFWYPTDEQNFIYDITDDSVWIHPKEARNVSLSKMKQKYPLILMSHGHRGDRRERTWLADALVRQGYIVASVEHHGNAWYQYNPLSSFCFWDRAKDISFALTCLLENPEYKNQIDQQKIGFVGYSMGGMTGLALAGAEAKYVKEVAAMQLKLAGDVSQESFNTLDFSDAEKSYLEPRIRSILLICPATFAYQPESLKQIKTPIGLIASIDDEVLPHQDHANKIIQNMTPFKLKLLKNKTSHYAFLNRMTEKGYTLLQKAVGNPSGINWTPIHKDATQFAITFFKETL
ncbi:MAG TPA: alpha/beta fold hydrolase [Chlamydiales bacterium]|nr:alpha/beta fold hydrolase [Chlamydiales bacterium]